MPTTSKRNKRFEHFLKGLRDARQFVEIFRAEQEAADKAAQEHAASFLQPARDAVMNKVG